jgi:demethylmenaquinone methyltransferase/2-methoxy-6-polyprenyl-1,4-benzoquinol methylase
MSSSQQEHICQIFDTIAKAYDKANRLLSFGQDRRWRNALVEALDKSKELSVLDIATGTGDTVIALCEQRPNINKAVGIDLAEKMLVLGREKAKKKALEKISFLHADASQMPFSDKSFDAASISFGIRNVTNFENALKEIHRVLKPNGQALILEFSLPKNAFIRFVYLFYFRLILPLFGGLISGNFQAYQYLNKSVEQFPYGEAFLKHLAGAGFRDLEAKELSFGIATLYSARK